MGNLKLKLNKCLQDLHPSHSSPQYRPFVSQKVPTTIQWHAIKPSPIKLTFLLKSLPNSKKWDSPKSLIVSSTAKMSGAMMLQNTHNMERVGYSPKEMCAMTKTIGKTTVMKESQKTSHKLEVLID